MSENVVIQSVIEEPAKHLASAATTPMGVATGDITLAVVAAAASLVLTCYLIYKTHLSVKLLKIKLAKEDRRD